MRFLEREENQINFTKNKKKFVCILESAAQKIGWLLVLRSLNNMYAKYFQKIGSTAEIDNVLKKLTITRRDLF